MRTIPKTAWMLGYAGLIPFAILTLALLFGFDLPFLPGARLDWWLATYAAIVLSFLGAVYWGIVLVTPRLSERETTIALLYGVAPGVIAWFAFMLPVRGALVVMGILIMLTYVADAFLLFPRLDSEYAKLRLHLSVAVLVMLFAVAVGGTQT